MLLGQHFPKEIGLEANTEVGPFGRVSRIVFVMAGVVTPSGVHHQTILVNVPGMVDGNANAAKRVALVVGERVIGAAVIVGQPGSIAKAALHLIKMKGSR